VNAGGVQIAPSIRLVIAMTGIAHFVAGRTAAALASKAVADDPVVPADRPGEGPAFGERGPGKKWEQWATVADGAGGRSTVSPFACERLGVMFKEFDARLQKGENPGAWTCVVMDDVAELFGTRGLVKIRGVINGQPFDGALMAQGDGTHRLPVRAKLRKAIGKEAGDTVHVRIDERIG
jgi:hypothetical protein